MSKKTLAQIKDLARDCILEHIEHETIGRSSEEASRIRGTAIEEGAKAIILQDSKGIFQVVLEAHKKIDMKALKNIREEKNITLAHPDEVERITDCVVGSVPPFGVLWNLPVYADEELLSGSSVIFSAGTHEDSIRIAPTDLIRLNHAQIVRVSKEK